MLSDSKRKNAGIKKAKNLSPTEAEIEQLMAILSEAQNPRTKMRAAEALGKIGEPAIKPLASALTEERWEVRSNVILALEKIGQPATHVFQEAMTDQDWFVRATAVKALGQIKDPRAVKILVNILSDKDWFVRERAAEALSKIGEPAIDPLIAALKDRNGLVRERAAEVLGKVGDETSIKPLMEAFHDDELYVRAKAVLAFERVNKRIVASASH
ncbi:MAG TPA: HEAT repeat domain-containing protein [Candidatus Bathyarchaeia archaeon]|nr:HEAT repeat domain-containing protein [Candidatus Bathyarchaeia archaeon]